MSTLTLPEKRRTSVHVAETQSPIGQFAVMRMTRRNMRFTALHPDIEAATKEARRLHAIAPGARFLIVSAVGQIGFDGV